MKILLDSFAYAPRVGGIEAVSQLLKEQLVARGHQVTVVTRTPAEENSVEPDVLRNPGRRVLARRMREHSVLLQSNLSLPVLGLAWRIGLPSVVLHHTWIARSDGRVSWKDRFKRHATLFLANRNLAVSEALAGTLPGPCGLFPNPYRADLFRPDPSVPRRRDLVFVGRLVSDKGTDLLLEALSGMDEPQRPQLTIIGEGPDRSALEKQAQDLGLHDEVEFLGNLPPDQVARQMQQHRVLVAPSRWNEPYGLIALEGLACGCRIVGSSGGGLPEAMGGFGWLFPNGDIPALREAIRQALSSSLDPAGDPGVQTHLMAHHPEQVAAFCEKVLQEVCKRN